MSLLWQPLETFAALPSLQPSELQIWRVDLPFTDAAIEGSMTYLTEEERARANRRKDPLSRQHVAAGRACLRVLLGEAIGVDPRTVPIATGANGKPELSRGVSQRVSFNVAHSENIILIALCLEACVGVDLERIDPRMDFMPVAIESFTAAENLALASITDLTQQRKGFYRYWTRKEAVLKADGRGLRVPMSSFEVPTLATASAPVRIGDGATPYYVNDLPLGENFEGAFALDAPDYRVSLLRFPLFDNLSTPK